MRVTQEGERLRLGLIGDDPMRRGGLRRRLEALGVDVAFEAEGLQRVSGLSREVDLLVVDVGSDPGRFERADVAVLALVDDDPADHLHRDATSVLPAAVDDATLGLALKAVAAGLFVAPREAMRRGPIPGEAEPLTPREEEVLLLLAEGLSNKLIAARLGVSDHTAKFHVTSVMTKVGATTRTEAVVRATRLGLLRL